MGTRLSGSIGSRSLRFAGVAFASVALYLAACRGSAKDQPKAANPPRVALGKLLGAYSGSMTTRQGVEALVLQITEITPLEEGFAFRYTLRTGEQREEGLGILRPGETSTQVCFANEVCGWLLVEEGNLRISSGLKVPSSWYLEKS